MRDTKLPNEIAPYDLAQATITANPDRFLYVADRKKWVSYRDGHWVGGTMAELELQEEIIKARANLMGETPGGPPVRWREITEVISFLRTMPSIRTTKHGFDQMCYDRTRRGQETEEHEDEEGGIEVRINNP